MDNLSDYTTYILIMQFFYNNFNYYCHFCFFYI
nr:MAG TPA: hypothetical protein [Caudoviricetes sp.]